MLCTRDRNHLLVTFVKLHFLKRGPSRNMLMQFIMINRNCCPAACVQNHLQGRIAWKHMWILYTRDWNLFLVTFVKLHFHKRGTSTNIKTLFIIIWNHFPVCCVQNHLLGRYIWKYTSTPYTRGCSRFPVTFVRNHLHWKLIWKDMFPLFTRVEDIWLVWRENRP